MQRNGTESVAPASGIFLFPEECKASALQMHSRSRRPPFHGDWGEDPNKQKRLGSTQTLLASFFAMMECRLRGDQLLRLEWYCYDEKLFET